MTDDLLQRLRAATDGVTEGPWKCEIDQDNGRPRIENAEKLITEVGNAESLWDAGDEWEANGRFIAAARTLIPEAADRIATLEAKVVLMWEAANQARWALAGFVSAKSAIDKLDAAMGDAKP